MAERQTETTPDHWSGRGFIAVKVNCVTVGVIHCDMAGDYSEFKVESRFHNSRE